ncbi:STM3941 family protein [Mangrovimonas sp. YM274]|uniref:STM3941 family protein n=1 Tax=Mangrovimonas sp. YM274 TaxID=3070660 RepID=UPI0027DD394D|nr:STM3941 family protein [Mangrovimonas sp. YM274]WMI68190.1 STM3941 family protein [Mangrovimonas sp. YM274]
MESVKYYRNSKSKTKDISLSIFLFLIGVTLTYLDNFVVGILISIIALIIIVRALLKLPSVTVNELGIVTKVNGIGLTKWDYIQGFEIKKLFNTTCIALIIKDQDKYINSKNKIIQKLIKSNLSKVGSPVIIPSQEFNKDLNIVIKEFENFLKNHKK